MTLEESVLLVEDDAALRFAIQRALRSAGYRTVVADTGPKGLEAAMADPPDVVLLDVMLPGMNGFEICEELRRMDADLPIIMLTAKGEETDKVRGLRIGADDYLVKPVGVDELLARIDAALRRRRLSAGARATIGDLEVDFEAHTATRRGEPVEMTTLEMKLLRFLLRNEGKLVSRTRILSAVWGADYFGTDRTVDNFVNRLRTKLEADPKSPRFLTTVRGGGYRLTRTETKP